MPLAAAITTGVPYALLSSYPSGGSSQADMFVSLACDLMTSSLGAGPNILGQGEGASPRAYKFHCQGASPARSRRGSHDGGASPTWDEEWSPKQPRKRLGRWSLDGNASPAAELAAAWAQLAAEHSSDAQWLAESEGDRDRGSSSRLQDMVDLEGGVSQPLLLSGHPGAAGRLAAGQLALTPRRPRRRWEARAHASLRVAWEHMRLGYDEIPDWMRDNCLIQGQYRPQLPLAAAARSLFSLHNETFNVWSHLVGFAATLLVLLAISLEQLPATTSPAPGSPKWPMYVSLFTSMYLYLISSAAHLFHVVGKAASDMLWRLDHTAIAVACAGAFFPICTYAFPCNARATVTYVSVTCLLALVVICVSLLPAFHLPKYRSVRATVQLSFGIWAQVPLMHATWLLLKHSAALSALLLVYAALGVLVLGAVVFASRATDRLFPGRVDLIGSSHNILHALVVVSNLLFIGGARELWLWHNSSSRAC